MVNHESGIYCMEVRTTLDAIFTITHVILLVPIMEQLECTNITHSDFRGRYIGHMLYLNIL